MVTTAPDADAGAFPLDTAIKVTNLDDAIVKAAATGTLRAALVAIAGQVSAPPGVTAPYGSGGASIGVPVAAVATGARAAIDQTQGWHKTLSNVPLADIDGLADDVTFDIQDADCDANVLNASQLVTVVRIWGELRFWGNRTCAAPDSDFVFESACRTADPRRHRRARPGVAMDKPLLPSFAKDIVEQINEKFRTEKRAGRILGSVATFDGARNPTEQLNADKLLIGYRYTFVPLWRRSGWSGRSPTSSSPTSPA